ncbi:arylamine N-acetyltransferase family protein [Neobacillus citreus]|uniref:Arylamine N-acetyltransferase n=1 Tax=Neobacillus citreus TaxID=2833578 RepID=A0A942SUN3_9BACI|nr:arylamine N-acetyltransferase [Neobacillus citreus]MCH6268954.1 arylamine N-acetyltransferase [Neobacillus citreus]
MGELNLLFRKRIGYPQDETVTFEKVDTILDKTAKSIPFENLCIIANKTAEISKENLKNKILLKYEGGLCYDLNTILFYFLIENGFNVSLVQGVVYNHIGNQWSSTGRTHVAIVITHNEYRYLIDTGFGGNLPLKPVPFSGEIVTSQNGEFRIEQTNTEQGNYILHMKLNYKDQDWKMGYAFDTRKSVDESDLNEVQKIIIEHPESSFNKKPLITRFTDRGNLILTDTSLTEWTDGKMVKKDIAPEQFKLIAKEQFGI